MKKIFIGSNISKDLYDWLVKTAEDEGRNLSAHIRHLITQERKRREAPQRRD